MFPSLCNNEKSSFFVVENSSSSINKPQKRRGKGEEEEGLFCIANNVESTRIINKYTDYPLQSLKIDVILKRMCGKRIFLMFIINLFHLFFHVISSSSRARRKSDPDYSCASLTS